MISVDQIRQLPKAELHLHLDGSMRVETVADLARERGITLDDSGAPGLADDLEIRGQARDLADYLDKFALPLQVLQDAPALERASYELLGDLAAEQVRYAEVRFAPPFHTQRGLSVEEVIESVLAGLRRGRLDHGVRAGLIVCCMRQFSPEENRRLTEVAARYRDVGVVGLDLAGDEAVFDRSLLPWEAFKVGQDQGLGITVHAGEAAGPPSIRAALDLGAQRLGHGARLAQDRALLDEVRAKGIALEMCPTSNVQTRAVPDVASLPIDRYLRSQLLVTVNTDNRTVSATTLTDEYWLLVREFGWGWPQIHETTINALEAAFLPADVKAQLVAEYETAWATVLGGRQ